MRISKSLQFALLTYLNLRSNQYIEKECWNDDKEFYIKVVKKGEKP